MAKARMSLQEIMTRLPPVIIDAGKAGGFVSLASLQQSCAPS